MNPQLQSLQQAAEGLYYLSESDYPFEAFALPAGTNDVAAVLRGLSGKGTDAPVETQTLDYFFRNQVKEYGGESAERQAVIARFRQLQQLLESSLTNVQVYRIGQVQVDAFIAGQANDGSWMGLRTRVIET